MRRLKWLFISLLIMLAVALVLKLGWITEELGKTGYDVTLSVTGMTRLTSMFSVLNALQKIDKLVIDDAAYEVINVMLPLGKKKGVEMIYTPSTGERSFKQLTDESTEPVFENKIGLRLKPDEPKYFTLKVWALADSDPADGVNDAFSERVKDVLIKAVEDLGFEASIVHLEAREATSMKRSRFRFN